MNNITICKFRSSDLVRKGTFVIFVGDDIAAKVCRIEPRRSRRFIHESQIADYGRYLYMPEDVVPRDENYYVYPKPINKKEMSKLEWWNIKQTHSYKGEEYEM